MIDRRLLKVIDGLEPEDQEKLLGFLNRYRAQLAQQKAEELRAKAEVLTGDVIRRMMNDSKTK